MAAASVPARSSSSARRAVRLPPTVPAGSSASGAPAAPDAPPAASLAPLAVSRTSTERCIPVYVPRPGEEPALEHVPEADPAYHPIRDARQLADAERQAYLATLSSVRVREEIAAAWAATPAVLWGGLTLAGCVLHAAFIPAALVLIATAVLATLPFLHRRRFLPVGVAGGLLAALIGPYLLHAVGGILTAAAGRVLWPAPAAATGLHPVGSTVNAWLCLSVLLLAGLISAVSFVRGIIFEIVALRAWLRRKAAGDSSAAWPLRVTRWRRRSTQVLQRLRGWLGWK